jgi:thiol:disulfide interchange protein
MRRYAAHLLSILLILLCSGSTADELSPAGSATELLSGSPGTPRFLKVDKAYPLQVRLEQRTLVLAWAIAPEYYLYRERMKFAIEHAGETQAVEADLPPGEEHDDAVLGMTQVYRGALTVQLPLDKSPPARLVVHSQGCADAGLCYPPRTQWFDIDAGGTVAERSNPPPARVAPPAATPASSALSLPWMMLLAALGGVILNLMPCVFPVLSLKLLSMGSSHLEHRALHALLYSAGVVLSFLLIAAVLYALRAGGAVIGWGFQLQSPVFVAALAYLFATMGLSLSGVVNLGAGLMGFGDSLARHQGYAGSFFTGVLACVVASPCTAPFMGSALGFALTQPGLVGFSIFAALGMGMALPFLLVGLVPALRHLLPRPGPWMDGFKQLLAFPLYAAALWLLWVLGNQTGVNGMATVGAGCLLLAFSLWLWQRAAGHRHPLLGRALAAVAVGSALLLLRSPMLAASVDVKRVNGAAAWQVYEPDRFAALRRAGTPVFVNITADWCLTCLANEKLALSDASVAAAFARRGVIYMKGDWTNADPQLTRLLQSHGRSGVPLYLYYPEGTTSAPEMLPQLLTPSLVLSVIDRENP